MDSNTNRVPDVRDLLADRQRQCSEISERIREAIDAWADGQSDPISLNALLGAFAGQVGAVLASIEDRALADQAIAEFLSVMRTAESRARQGPKSSNVVLVEVAPPDVSKH